MRRSNKSANIAGAITIGLTTCAMVAMATAPALAKDYFKGKTITLLTGFPAGSGVTLGFRLFAPYFSKYTPGQPKMIVKSMPGGGGQKAANFVFEKAKPDGSILLTGPSKTIESLLGRPGARVDHSKIQWIGIAGGNHLVLARSDIAGGLKAPSDIVKSDYLKIGGRTPGGGFDLAVQMSMDLLGVKYNYVTGYRGEGKMYPALRSGEIQVMSSSLSGYRGTFEAGIVKPGKGLVLFSVLQMKSDGGFYMRDNENPDLPGFLEVYKKIHGGKMPSGPKWEALKLIRMHALAGRVVFAPPGTPKAAVEALRIGYQKARQDPAFLADQKAKFNENWSFQSPKGGQDLIKRLSATDPKMLAYIKDYINGARKRAQRAPKKKK